MVFIVFFVVVSKKVSKTYLLLVSMMKHDFTTSHWLSETGN